MSDYGMHASTEGEFRAIGEMIELLLVDGYTVELRTQAVGSADIGEYSVTIRNEIGNMEACSEMPRLFDAVENVFSVTPTTNDFGEFVQRPQVQP